MSSTNFGSILVCELAVLGLGFLSFVINLTSTTVPAN